MEKKIQCNTNTYDIQSTTQVIFDNSINLCVYVFGKNNNIICSFNVSSKDKGNSLQKTINDFLKDNASLLIVDHLL